MALSTASEMSGASATTSRRYHFIVYGTVFFQLATLVIAVAILAVTGALLGHYGEYYRVFTEPSRGVWTSATFFFTCGSLTLLIPVLYAAVYIVFPLASCERRYELQLETVPQEGTGHTDRKGSSQTEIDTATAPSNSRGGRHAGGSKSPFACQTRSDPVDSPTAAAAAHAERRRDGVQQQRQPRASMESHTFTASERSALSRITSASTLSPLRNWKSNSMSSYHRFHRLRSLFRSTHSTRTSISKQRGSTESALSVTAAPVRGDTDEDRHNDSAAVRRTRLLDSYKSIEGGDCNLADAHQKSCGRVFADNPLSRFGSVIEEEEEVAKKHLEGEDAYEAGREESRIVEAEEFDPSQVFSPPAKALTATSPPPFETALHSCHGGDEGFQEREVGERRSATEVSVTVVTVESRRKESDRRWQQHSSTNSLGADVDEPLATSAEVSQDRNGELCSRREEFRAQTSPFMCAVPHSAPWQCPTGAQPPAGQRVGRSDTFVPKRCCTEGKKEAAELRLVSNRLSADSGPHAVSDGDSRAAHSRRKMKLSRILLNGRLFRVLQPTYFVFNIIALLLIFFFALFGSLATSFSSMTQMLTMEEGWKRIFYSTGGQQAELTAFSARGPAHDEELLRSSTLGPSAGFFVSDKINEKVCRIQMHGHCSGGFRPCNETAYTSPEEAFSQFCPYCPKDQARIATFSTLCTQRYYVENTFPVTFTVLCVTAVLCVLVDLVLGAVQYGEGIVPVLTFQEHRLLVLVYGDLKEVRARRLIRQNSQKKRRPPKRRTPNSGSAEAATTLSRVSKGDGVIDAAVPPADNSASPPEATGREAADTAPTPLPMSCIANGQPHRSY